MTLVISWVTCIQLALLAPQTLKHGFFWKFLIFLKFFFFLKLVIIHQADLITVIPFWLSANAQAALCLGSAVFSLVICQNARD